MVQAEIKSDSEELALPDKRYFKIGETSLLLGVKPHVLRYWETEFPQVRPFKSSTGQRLYRRRDVEALIKIQRLLYKERFTIMGARQALGKLNFYGDENNSLNDFEMESQAETKTGIEVETGAEPGACASLNLLPQEEQCNMATINALQDAKKELEDILQLLD